MKRLWLSAVLLGCVCLAAGDSVADPVGDVLPPEAREAIRGGVEFERSREWLRAIDHYEDALKRWPDAKDLQYGLRRSKIHFGIERRYTDRSFESSLLRLSQREALALLEEVLDKIRGNYVDPISSTSYIAHGTESLYLALANEKFLRVHLPQARTEDVQRMRKILRDEFWNKPVPHPSAAQQTVLEVCGIAANVLGLRPTPVVLEYVFGGCNALDDYSSFLTPDRLDDLYGNIEGEFVGLGIEMKEDPGHGMLLVNVLPGSPAEAGGMAPGEHIVAIDGVNCRSLTADEAARLLRGASGSRVRLTIQGADSRIREGDFLRREVHVKSIPVATMLPGGDGIGYIQMTGFQKSSAEELDQALAKLHRSGMRALVWDVRGNPGGLLTAAVEVLDRFIPEGVLVSTRGRTADQNWSYSAHRSGTWTMPIVLLVDGDSASASEIVAGALRDHQRGTIVGRQTYGKWSVQSIFNVRGSTGLRLTTAKFYSPRGHTLGKIGVKPDVIVEATYQYITFYRSADEVNPAADADLAKAVELLQKQFAQR